MIVVLGAAGMIVRSSVGLSLLATPESLNDRSISITRNDHIGTCRARRLRATLTQVSWRRGTKGRLTARFAPIRVGIADGVSQRIGSSGAQHMPGEEAWLVGEHRSNGERKYYLSNLPADIAIKELAGAIKARWICEQAHQQLKEELGLDHFEGRSWIGLHRHALMTMMAYAFLQSRRLAQAGRKKKSRWAAASTQPPGSSPSHS